MKRQLIGRWLSAAGMSVAVLLSGCGGGGGSGTAAGSGSSTYLSGTAASGSPIAGTVLVKDSTGVTRTSIINANGVYQIDVSGMSPPFVLQANGLAGNRSVTLYSAATASDIGGIIDITPLSDLMVALVAHEAVGTYFNGNNFGSVTTSSLAGAQNSVQSQLQSVMTALGLSPTTDLLRVSFAANHTGFDALLDSLQETATANTVVLANLADGSSISCDVTTGDFSGTLTANNVAVFSSAMLQITAQFDALSKLFAAALPAPSDPSLTALFDQADFMHDGRNLAMFLDAITSDSRDIGMQINAINIEMFGPTQTLVGYVMQTGGITRHAEMYFNLSGSRWLMAGNQHKVDVQLKAASYLPDTMSGGMMGSSPVPKSGFELDVTDPGGVGAAYAVVTGPGLPSSSGGTSGSGAGALLFKNPGGEFQIASPGAPYGGTATNGITSPIDFFALSDTVIGNLGDNTPYLVQVYDGAGSRLDSFTVTMAKAPYLASALTAGNFPVVTMPSNWMMMSGSGGSASLSWTLPSGYSSDELRAEQWGSAGEMTIMGPDLNGSDTAAMMIISAYSGTMSSSFVWLAVSDMYGRQFAAGTQVQ